MDVFCQPWPHFALKHNKSRQWTTRKRPMTRWHVSRHLNGSFWIGSLPKWYPTYAIIDIDEKNWAFVEELKVKLQLSPQNSMTCSSESEDSYHILIRPEYNSKPPTLNLLHDAFEHFAEANSIEVYPAVNQTVRLPFGRGQRCIDPEYALYDRPEQLFYWFNKLNEFELFRVGWRLPWL